MKRKDFRQKYSKAVRSKIIGLLVIGASFCTGAYAQVTIGSGEAPAKGALLDMKEPNANTANGGITSTKGILFPRVALINLSSLSPLVNDDNSTDKLTHKGIVVYNVITSGDLKEGLYAWNGSRWIYVQDDPQAWNKTGNANTDPANNYVGTSDPTALSIRTDAKERIRVTESGNVGIGTNNPSNKLEVNGSVQIEDKTYLKKTAPAAASNGVSQLVVDNSSGEVLSLVTGKNSKAINYIKYVIECDKADKDKEEGHPDWIADFDTKIDSAQFTLVVVGSTFDLNGNSGLIASGTGSTFGPSSVFAFTGMGTGTWHLTADYKKATTTTSDPGTWTIYCLAINISIVKEVPITNGNYPNDKSKFKFTDTVRGGAPGPPEGLYDND